MRNFEFGTKVRAFAKLGFQKKPSWAEGIYLGNNTVEFRNGSTQTFEDYHVKILNRLENSEDSLNQFVAKSWEDLKKIVSDAMLKFFPDKKLEFDEKEHFIICEGYSIAPVIFEIESFDAFTETPVWQLSVEVSTSGSYWDPPDVDFQEIKSSSSEEIVAGCLLNKFWEDQVSGYWETVSYSRTAKSNF